MEKFIPYARQSISAEDIQAVSAALQQDWITRGPQVEAFENAIAGYCGATYAVAFNSATSALMAACAAGGMGPSDRLVTTPNTFVATAAPAFHLGATPVFVDIDLSTGNANLEQMLANTEYQATRTRIFLAPVHFAGIAMDMRALHSQIRNPNVVIIEDAAHALGSCYPDGKKVGCCEYSDMAVFSFHPAKTMTTGEGGMVTTNDPELWHKLVAYRSNGIERFPPYISQPPAAWYYEVQNISGNYNVTEMQAALGLSQFQRLDAFIAHRRELVKRYREKLAGIPHLTLMTDKHDEQTAFHLFCVLIDFAACKISRTDCMHTLLDKGIGTQLHYIPLYAHPYFQKSMGDLSAYFPNMEKYYSQALSLPLYYDLTFDDVDRVVTTLRQVLKI